MVRRHENKIIVTKFGNGPKGVMLSCFSHKCAWKMWRWGKYVSRNLTRCWVVLLLWVYAWVGRLLWVHAQVEATWILDQFGGETAASVQQSSFCDICSRFVRRRMTLHLNSASANGLAHKNRTVLTVWPEKRIPEKHPKQHTPSRQQFTGAPRFQ